MKDKKCMFRYCFNGDLSQSCLVIATFPFASLMHHDDLSCVMPVFTTANTSCVPLSVLDEPGNLYKRKKSDQSQIWFFGNVAVFFLPVLNITIEKIPVHTDFYRLSNECFVIICAFVVLLLVIVLSVILITPLYLRNFP